MDSSIQIEERAAQWLAKRDGGEWSDRDEDAFNAWLEQSTLHVVAFVRLEAAWKQAKRLKALSAGVPPGTIPSPEDWQLAPFFDAGGVPETQMPASDLLTAPEVNIDVKNPNAGRLRPLFYVAASLLLAIGIGVALYPWPFGSTYRTPVGGLASVPMSDGSKVTLNTNSKIRLAVTETERRVELQQGEAFFEVAKDLNRPFVVTAGDKRIVAVGTQFSVRRDSNGVRVLITEGKVRIEDETKPESPVRRDDGEAVVLSAGSMARASDAGVLVQEKTVPEIEGYLSWRTGHLIFRDMPLADAIAEFNRYNTRKIVIEDPTVAAIRVSGKFRSTQFEAFVRLLEEGFPVRARRIDDQIVLNDSRNAAGIPPAAQE